nr:carboxypeptidase-like regulatory domain-containing protein [Nocardioides flavescens]
MSKTGLLDPGVGGAISGTVTAASSQQPVGRILVQAYRTGRDGPVLVSQAASQADGTYSLAGLFPTAYVLKFSADGFTPVWYPAAPSRRGATEVNVAAQGSTQGIDAVVAGLPAQVSGSVDPGSALTPPVTTVVARVAGGTTQGAAPVVPAPGSDAPAAAGTVVARTTTGGDGGYTLPGLPAPATYELSFTSPGYAATKVLTTVNGGEQRLQPSVVLSAGGGQISGTVKDAGGPIGNVTVTTESGGEQVSVVTPTVGAVGAFTLGDLPTPGTYVLTFTADGHGSSTEIVDLAAGESRTDLSVTLARGTGSVSGRVTGPGGTKLGGVQVWVGGSSTGAAGTTGSTGTSDVTGGTGGTGTSGTTGTTGAPATTTLTQGLVGTFSLNGLQAPGEYTLTFTLDGYAPETVPVSLTADGPAPTVKVTMHSQLGTVSGTVTGPDGRRYDGATITASNGNRTWTTTSGAPGTALSQGGYRLAGLPAGTYSITVTAAGLTQQTAMVTVTEGGDVTQALRLGS